MTHFIIGLFNDLLIRVQSIIDDLNSRKHHPDIENTFVLATKESLNELQNEIKNDLGSGDLEVKELSKYNLRRYTTLYSEFQLLEIYRYQVILKYGETESYLNKKIRLIYDEIKCLQSVPLVSTINNTDEYYWVHPQYKIIAVPTGEEKSLLNLPDLYHEIGHLIYKQYEEDLVGSFRKELVSHFENQEKLVIDEDRSPALLEMFNDTLKKWKASWTEEFVCDLIGAYLVGCAYAWTNFKLTTIATGREETYKSTDLHPSDDARMRAIFTMLRQFGVTNDLKEVNDSWNTFINLIELPIPDNYNYFFPDSLIERLTKNVYKGCLNIGLASYAEQLKKQANPISKILNDAWCELRSNPKNYANWEKKVINKIRRNLGMG